ncbi:hypothetical protein A0H76_461 [Hepatospora eriocheir]|uniref:Uncharacterized protein n=1 Tax=Hepatospora eriocheir TaxID=1081669 RepID=A0A1X0Q9S3_9MICR|nr:hypothetical protein A0H76_461 [Hepatospora eriocheir]
MNDQQIENEKELVERRQRLITENKKLLKIIDKLLKNDKTTTKVKSSIKYKEIKDIYNLIVNIVNTNKNTNYKHYKDVIKSINDDILYKNILNNYKEEIIEEEKESEETINPVTITEEPPVDIKEFFNKE